jgi:hypothetical protein
MKYIVTKTDIFLKGKVYSEGSIIDSKNFTEEDIESVAHLLVPVEKSSNVAVTLDPDENDNTLSTAAPAKEKIKSPRKPKQQ